MGVRVCECAGMEEGDPELKRLASQCWRRLRTGLERLYVASLRWLTEWTGRGMAASEPAGKCKRYC